MFVDIYVFDGTINNGPDGSFRLWLAAQGKSEHKILDGLLLGKPFRSSLFGLQNAIYVKL